MVLFCALFAQLTNLQVIQANKLANAAGNTRVAERSFNQARGDIQTADGVVVARSEDVDGESTFKRRRVYPEAELFGHVTGFFSFSYGTTGVEDSYDDELKGNVFRLDDLSNMFAEEARTGNVTLSISKSLQQLARDQLNGRRGAVVAINPQNGEILAMYSNPTYDPNLLAKFDQKAVQASFNELSARADKPMLARAYRESYAPGSTFKVVTAAAALERQPDLAAKEYPKLKTLDLPQTDRMLPNFGGGTCGGTLPDLLRVSCNTGFAQMGLDLGGDNLAGQAEAFGFNKRPPIDLPAAAISTFPDPSGFDRNKPALAQSAIGQQDVSASPLQMALVAAGIGNGGVIQEPHVMREIRDEEGDIVRRGGSRRWVQATSADVAAEVRDAMVQVVKAGTARGIAVPGVEVAAKTGTAQTTDDNAHAWIIGFAPADKPTVAVAVIVESQPGLGDVTGGRIAAPIARAIIEAALKLPQK